MGSAAELCELGTPPRTAQSLAGGRWQSAGTESKKNEESNIFKLCIVECSGFRYEDFMAKKLKTLHLNKKNHILLLKILSITGIHPLASKKNVQATFVHYKISST